MIARIAALTVTLLAVGPGTVPAQGIKLIDPIDSLRNMKEIGVVVEDMPGLQNALSPDALKSAVEARLRAAGIEVPARVRKDPLDAFVPYLYVNVNAIKIEPGGYAFSISLQFKRAVEVNNVDSNRNFLFATTWETGGLAIVPFTAVRTIQQTLDECVTAFLHDHAQANAAR